MEAKFYKRPGDVELNATIPIGGVLSSSLRRYYFEFRTAPEHGQYILTKTHFYDAREFHEWAAEYLDWCVRFLS